MRYVGIDPSSHTGFVILNQEGDVILDREITTKEKKDPQRFVDFSRQLLNYVTPKDRICIEGFSYNSKGDAASFMYGLGFILREHFIANKIPYHDIPPKTLKKFATQKGNSAKNIVMREVLRVFGYSNDSDNITDAYVLAQIARCMDDSEAFYKYQQEVVRKL